MKNYLNIGIALIIILCTLSCKKEWLDEKPDLKLATPSTIEDLQAILDNSNAAARLNGEVPLNQDQAALGEIASDDFYLTIASWNSLTSYKQKNAYIWGTDVYGSEMDYIDWRYTYQRILYANVVSEGADKISPSSELEIKAWKQVKGSALFYRAYNHFSISQLYCKPYNAASASTDLGIPLRIKSDINEKSVRSSVGQTYDQMLDDLRKASLLLPVETPITPNYRVRPTKTAAYAMLARVFLSMQQYDSALVYADKSLLLYNTLIDYNTLSTTATAPFTQLNSEVLFHNRLLNLVIFAASRMIVEPTLISSYSNNDLRRSLYFGTNAGNTTFKGSYEGSAVLFSGLATDEVYLIRAECYARGGNTTQAMADLNTLIKTRWKNTVPYTNIVASDAKDAISKVLAERRKELCFRGLRWTDLRRLNIDPAYAVTIARNVGSTYTLLPNDNKYVFPIPYDVIQISGIAQNPR